MPTFAFSARDPRGRTQRGTQQAASALDLANQLRARGWLVLTVQAAGEDKGSALAEQLNPKGWLPVRSVDVEMSLNQLAVMLRSGLTLLAALGTCAEHADRIKLSRILRRVSERIQEGSTFSDALAEHRCFSQLTVQLVKVGEQTGNLAKATQSVRRHLARQVERKIDRLVAALEPALTLGLVVVVGTIMLAIYEPMFAMLQTIE